MTVKKGAKQAEPKVVKERWELHISDTVKIQEYDAYNFAVLVLTDGVNPKTKEVTQNWKLDGYYTTVRGALTGILKHDLLVDMNKVNTIRNYQEETRKAFALIQKQLEGADTNNEKND